MAGLLPITPIALTCYSISNLFYKYLLPGQERPHLPHNLKYSYDVKHFQSDQSWSCGVTKVDLEVVWLKTSSSSFPPSSLCRRPVEQVGGLPLRGEAGKENPSRSILHYCTLSLSTVQTNTIWISTNSQRWIQRLSRWVTILQGQRRSRHLPESTSQDDHWS